MNDDYVTLADALNRDALWPSVKGRGLYAVPSGPPSAAASRLIQALEDQSLMLVPVGELESFDTTIGCEGAEWVSEMLEKRGHETNEEARRLVAKVIR